MKSSTAKIQLKAGPATELSYQRNYLFFFSSLSSVPSGQSETTELLNMKSKQESCRYFREISSAEWRGDPLTRELLSVSPKVQWREVLSQDFAFCPKRKGKLLACYRIVPPPWGWKPLRSTALRNTGWLPALEDLWVHFYRNDLYALRRALCLQCWKKPGVGLQREELCREVASLRNTRSTAATAENFCRKGWCGSPASSLGFVPVAPNATVWFCKASNLISVKVALMCIQAVHTLLKSTSLKCFLVMVYILLRMNHRCFVVRGFFPLNPISYMVGEHAVVWITSV